MMQKIKNLLVTGSGGKPMATDIFFEDDGKQKPVVVYAHGFNGFKDWGNFDMIAERFAKAGFLFVKFNFSHNGTTPEQPESFADLEAFGHNNYTIQLHDLGLMIDWLCSTENPHCSAIDAENISLIGHSMGGGISIIKTAEDSRIKKLATWASISECKTPWGNWPPEKIDEWKRTGVAFYLNGRTLQNMPLYYQLHQDYLQHKDRLDIEQAIGRIQVPILICHGTQDPAVPVASAYSLAEWQSAAQLFTLQSDHVFGRSHPWQHAYLPAAMEVIVGKTIAFMLA